MSLEKRAGRWWIAYYPQGAKGGKKRIRLPVHIQTEDEAQAAHDGFMHRNKDASGYHVLQDEWKEYLIWYRPHHQPRTADDVEAFGVRLVKYFGSDYIENIGDEYITLFIALRKADSKKAGGIKNRTLNKELSYFSSFLKFCRRKQRIEVQTFHIDNLPAQRPLPEVLSIDEIMKILEAAEPFYRCFFLFLYVLGLRINEARNIKIRDIDQTNKTVTVRQKGGTFKRLPLAPIVWQSLQEIVPPERFKTPDVYVFESKYRGREGKPIGDVRKAIERACKKAGVTRHIHAHTFRHSIATMMMGEGVNLRIIQKYLGHAKIETTQFYTSVSLGHLREAGDMIDALMKKN